MIKRIVVTGLKARGYVDGRYVGEEKKDPGAARSEDILGRKRRGKAGAGPGAGKGRGKKRGAAQSGQLADNLGNTIGGKGGRRGKPQGRGGQLGGVSGEAGIVPQPQGARGQGRAQPRNQPRKNRSGKKTPFRAAATHMANPLSPSEAAVIRRMGDEAKSGQFAEALAAQATVKRERLHKVLAQSGHGSRRDMEIMISSGRVMVNGIVATTGTQISPGDSVMIDHRPVKLKFSEELPRILLYHKPEGEIVTTNDPGNRITVFDNLPKVENGKWVAIGRLDINTSGLLIFTTNGELANRFMHPRYEVEREYAVRILGELTEEQTQALLTGVNIDFERDEDEEETEPAAPARFDSIEKREGEGGGGANQWYHVTIKEGRNREVRKMFESQGLTVSRLIRTRFGKIELPPRLARGKMMELAPDQVRSVLVSAGMGDDLPLFEDAGPSKRARGRDRSPGGGKPPRGIGPVAPAGAVAVDAGTAERGGDAARKRRNRRGGKNLHRNPGAGSQPPAMLPVHSGTGEASGIRDGQGDAAAQVDAANADGVNAAAGGKRPPGTAPGPGRNTRNRSRRNFRGRNGRRGKAAAGEGGVEPGNDGGGGNTAGNHGDDGRGNTGGNDRGGGSDGDGNDGNR